MKRHAINAFALAPISAETRRSLDDALATVIHLDTKFMGGHTLTNEESGEYLSAQAMLATFSGQVVAQTLQVFLHTPRGARVIAAALPPTFAVNVTAAPVEVRVVNEVQPAEVKLSMPKTTTDHERDAAGRIKRSTTRVET